MDSKVMMEKLQAPFPAEALEWRVGVTNKEKTKGIALAYVTNRAIMDRLDEVVGPTNWQNEFLPWKNGQICAISIFDAEQGRWVTKQDGADDTDIESTKGGLSGAMKRAAAQWGIGRYLYKLPTQWVDIKAQGRSYVLSEIPSLPKWATLPGDKVTIEQAQDVFPDSVEVDAPVDPVKTITKKQQKELFELANNNADIVRDVISELGIERTADIPVTAFAAVCEEIKAMVAEVLG
jgi:hypothetical protein